MQKGFPQRIEWAGADVAEDDAQRPDDQGSACGMVCRRSMGGGVGN